MSYPLKPFGPILYEEWEEFWKKKKEDEK